MGRNFFFPQYALEHVTWEIKTGLKNALEIQGYSGDSKVIKRLDKRTHIRSSKFPVTSSLLLVRQVKQELFSQWCPTQQPTYGSVHASHILNEISQTHKWIYWGSLYPLIWFLDWNQSKSLSWWRNNIHSSYVRWWGRSAFSVPAFHSSITSSLS